MPTVQQQTQIRQPSFQGGNAAKYQLGASKLLPSVTDRNPYLKEQVGNLIFDFVQNLIGQDKAPKITGMLIELPVVQVKQYLSSYDALKLKVSEANNLLVETKGSSSDKTPK